MTVGVLWLWIRLTARSKKRNPLTEDLLRSPGESLRDQIEDLNWDFAIYFSFASIPIIWTYSIYISKQAFEGKAPGIVDFMFYLAVAVGGYGWLCWKIWQILKKRRLLTLGYEAELAVGQELNQLGRYGFHIFHDVPAKEFNVDHIAVGPNGVFAIETKGRPKLKSSVADARSGWEVNYDGKHLDFPLWRETAPLDQAIRQAKWVREWLSKAVGEPVQVQPVLVLPGWYIKRTSGTGIPVINATYIAKFFPKAGQGDHLSAQLIDRIVHQLEQRCRNVVPRAYGKTQEKD